MKLKETTRKHVENSGTMGIAADAWTKERRKFIAWVAYLIVKWRLSNMLFLARQFQWVSF